MVALRHELAREREYRGRKYSMNDLCALKLASNGTQVRHTTDTGIITIPRVPPPPPVPLSVIAPLNNMFSRAMREEPQPERTVQVAGASEASAEPIPVLEDAIVEDTPVEYVPDEHAEELTDIAIERMESEGAPDGSAE
jgi:hypothetical protein